MPHADFATAPAPARPWSRVLDAALAGLLGLAAAWLTWWLYGQFDPLRLGSEQWFQADLARVWDVLTDRYSANHERARLHPLFSLVNTTVVYGLRRGLGLDSVVAVRLWLALAGGAVVSSCYAVARIAAFARHDAVIICGLAVASASAIFWMPVPETKAVGAITVLVALGVAAMVDRRAISDVSLVGTAGATLSMTTSNFMAGLALLVSARPARRALQLAINAFFVVSVLQVAQQFIYPRAGSLTSVRSEQRFLFDPSGGTAWNKLNVSVLSSMVMPRIDTPIEFDTRKPMLSIQRTSPGSGSPFGLVAVLLWAGALLWGVGVMWQTWSRSAFVRTCLLTAGGQIVFHLVYGDQTFLYTLHFLPVLVFIAAHVTRSRYPIAGRGLLWALMALAAINNFSAVGAARLTIERVLPAVN